MLITHWNSHRLGSACCQGTASALERIEMVAATIADVESGNHWAEAYGLEAAWIHHLDRAWLDLLLYKAEGDDYSTSASKEKGITNCNYAALRRMLTFDGRNRSSTVAVILADGDNAAWILNSTSFPVVKRQPREGEMYSIKRDLYLPGGKFFRTFVGNFVSKGTSKRRREDSPPPADAKAKKRHETRTIK